MGLGSITKFRDTKQSVYAVERENGRSSGWNGENLFEAHAVELCLICHLRRREAVVHGSNGRVLCDSA